MSEHKNGSTDLSALDRRTLRARAHVLKPVVWIAQAGASAGVLQEIDRALTAHELVKMHAAVDGRAVREEMLATICAQLGAQPVQVIGKMLVAFRPRPPAANDAREGRSKSARRSAGPKPASPPRPAPRAKRKKPR